MTFFKGLILQDLTPKGRIPPLAHYSLLFLRVSLDDGFLASGLYSCSYLATKLTGGKFNGGKLARLVKSDTHSRIYGKIIDAQLI